MLQVLFGWYYYILYNYGLASQSNYRYMSLDPSWSMETSLADCYCTLVGETLYKEEEEEYSYSIVQYQY